MKKDEQGVVWMHTGDECVIDYDGYCTVTGRIKDIIIRGIVLTKISRTIADAGQVGKISPL